MYICCKPIPTLILENDTAAKARSVGGFTMKRAGAVKFPNSVQLFKFCQKVLMHQRGAKVRDQEIGNILEFNPSDCSHWKRGEKNVKSVFALAKLAETLQVEAALVHDVASGNSNLDEAYFEFQETKAFREALQKVRTADPAATEQSRQRIEQFEERGTTAALGGSFAVNIIDMDTAARLGSVQPRTARCDLPV